MNHPLCRVCEQKESRYKCPKCKLQYCSAPCWKKHENNPTSCVVHAVKEERENERNIDDYHEINAITNERMQNLANNKELKTLVANPYLRNILKTIDRASDPDEVTHQLMFDPQFTEFVDLCLKLVQPQEE